MLSAADLASMRATAEQALPGTAVIQSGTLTSDGGGGHTETFTPSGTVPCRVAPINGSEREEGDRITAESEYVITLPAETTVETDDRIETGGITYNVTAVRDRSWEVTRRVEAQKITTPVIDIGESGEVAAFEITGTPAVGETLTAVGVPDDATLQWYRDSILISGATDSTYEVRAVDQGRDITCRALDPSNALSVPPGGGTGLVFDGAGRVAWTADAIDLSDTAHTLWALWQPTGSDGVSNTLLVGEDAAGQAYWAWYRMGGGSFWVPNSLGYYRYRLPPDDNEDLVWTTGTPGATNDTGITAVAADGLLSTFTGKPLAGGVGNELYASQYKRSGAAWVHDTNSPGRFNYQINFGSPLGADGKIALGVANGNDFLRANVYALAIFHDLYTDWDAVMAAGTTAAILALDPVWCTDASVNLEVDLTGNGGDMIESSGVDQADPLDADVWVMGP